MEDVHRLAVRYLVMAGLYTLRIAYPELWALMR